MKSSMKETGQSLRSDRRLTHFCAETVDNQHGGSAPNDNTKSNSSEAMVIDRIPFDNLEKEQWDLSNVKSGRESPSTLSATSASHDTSCSLSIVHRDIIGQWVGTEGSDDGTSSYAISADLHDHARLIQLVARRFLARKCRDAKRGTAAVKVQAVYRSWRCRMMVQILGLEKRLELTPRRTEYSLHWIEETKKHNMERCKKAIWMSAEESFRRNEKDLSSIQQTFGDLRAENKKMRAHNKILKELSDIQIKKHKKLREEIVSNQKGKALIAATLARLERRHKSLQACSTQLEDHIEDYSHTLIQVNDFLQYEKNLKAATKELILKALLAIKVSCEDEETAKRIIDMGMTSLERNDQYEKALSEKAHEKVRRDKQISGIIKDGVTVSNAKKNAKSGEKMKDGQKHVSTTNRKSIGGRKTVQCSTTADEKVGAKSISTVKEKSGVPQRNSAADRTGRTLPVKQGKSQCPVTKRQSVGTSSSLGRLSPRRVRTINSKKMAEAAGDRKRRSGQGKITMV